MNLKQAHKKIEHDRIKREIINIVERRLVYDVTIGMKAVLVVSNGRTFLSRLRMNTESSWDLLSL